MEVLIGTGIGLICGGILANWLTVALIKPAKSPEKGLSFEDYKRVWENVGFWMAGGKDQP